MPALPGSMSVGVISIFGKNGGDSLPPVPKEMGKYMEQLIANGGSNADEWIQSSGKESDTYRGSDCICQPDKRVGEGSCRLLLEHIGFVSGKQYPECCSLLYLNVHTSSAPSRMSQKICIVEVKKQ